MARVINFNQKGSLNILLIIAIISVFGIIAFLLVSFTSTFSKHPAFAATGNAIRGVGADGWADIVIGKSDYSEITPNTVVPGKVFEALSVIIDRSSTPNRIYVFDGNNSRILGFDEQ